jgi:hypothetical protein
VCQVTATATYIRIIRSENLFCCFLMCCMFVCTCAYTHVRLTTFQVNNTELESFWSGQKEKRKIHGSKVCLGMCYICNLCPYLARTEGRNASKNFEPRYHLGDLQYMHAVLRRGERGDRPPQGPCFRGPRASTLRCMKYLVHSVTLGAQEVKM